MSNCCGDKQEETSQPAGSAEAKADGGCCDTDSSRIDYFFWVPLCAVVALYASHFLFSTDVPLLSAMGHAVFSMMNTMAWGVVLGVLMVALLSYVPRDLVISAMGRGDGFQGLCRATAAGVLLDLCSHGILMVGAKLYERGASIGQVMAFLIASPWNSFSLTLILIAFIGLPWTLAFIALSIVVALLSGLIFQALVRHGVLPDNPNTQDLPEDFAFWPAFKQMLKACRITSRGLGEFLMTGIKESKMVIRWLLIGVLLASLIQVFVKDAYFQEYFGATMLGLLLTMLAATIIEVCSEGSTPIAADIFHRAKAPGNSFAFMMAGVSTDYTEIMILRERTRSWKLALFLPLVTLPQILVIAFIINTAT